jgi:demethylmenaquinone methyltransferase/2-methoxy-6-polyprenyl-1,4-benzoquinol methylase
MLDEAVAKQKRAADSRYDSVTFAPGDGLNLPVPDASFDAVTISFGLRNMADRHRALTEMRRVLRPGGYLWILEFSKPQRWFRPFYYFYLRHILPGIAGLVTGDKAAYVYLNETIEQFPGRQALSEEIKAAGFSSVESEGMTFGIVALHKAH